MTLKRFPWLIDGEAYDREAKHFAYPVFSMSVDFIAEIGTNHNGDKTMALVMADAAIDAGADWVKFQIYDLPAFLTPDNVYFADFEREALSFSAFAGIKKHIEARGGRFLATPFDLASLHFLHDIECDTIKISSGDMNNFQLIGQAIDLKKRIFISIGGAELAEIDQTVAFLRDKKAEFIILHCVLSYPADFCDLNLRFIQTLKLRYGGLVGYSDHSPGVEAAVAAVALGAEVIEKHFTIDRTLPGGDNAMSILPEELRRMRRECLNAHLALGEAERKPSHAEYEVRRFARKIWYAGRDLAAGHVISEDDVILLRPASGATGFAASDLSRILGSRLNRPVVKGDVLDVDAVG